MAPSASVPLAVCVMEGDAILQRSLTHALPSTTFVDILKAFAAGQYAQRVSGAVVRVGDAASKILNHAADMDEVDMFMTYEDALHVLGEIKKVVFLLAPPSAMHFLSPPLYATPSPAPYTLTTKKRRLQNRTATSLESQHNMVAIANILHQAQPAHVKYLVLPSRYKVPATDPFPLPLRGTTIDVMVFRQAYKVRILEPDIVAALDALHFVWDVQEHKRDMNLLALRTYKQICGDLLVPERFHVPEDDAWPSEVWNLHLGRVVRKIRSYGPDGPVQRKDELLAMGFVWEHADFQWNIHLHALQIYRRLHGHIKVPQFFKVPNEENATVATWPRDMWGLQLGRIVNRLRLTMDTMPTSHKHALDDLGMVWVASKKFSWEHRLLGLTTFKRLYGHLKVPKSFQVPERDPQWPTHIWKMQLGWVVKDLRNKEDTMPHDRKLQLLQLDFVWKKTPELDLLARNTPDLLANLQDSTSHVVEII
ncbi:hypothetical protein SDRG_04787 [Saprolegnia diclina VS20]|uniref:Helicase-associated domain-containing protein n=1 Tax=Saprolegnia diclina (strain VS20) TaxID=1156394 RepID=T0QUP7_SAPDV|nr:hypothetical protein SDRG_04787 [Saprolegnia diclina VS20]EQC37760.1 hypothetical protein SDRG_04787 [Saprolegnia diclina VS20]|eukprot:XP_008608693.1 hypothetical protein SDRG_04787 [Saprolegnia diclina VS20]